MYVDTPTPDCPGTVYVTKMMGADWRPEGAGAKETDENGVTVAMAAGSVIVTVKSEPRVADKDELSANDRVVVATVSVTVTTAVSSVSVCEETPTPGDPYPLSSETPIVTTVEVAKGSERETVLS